ncbi:MAG: hypothetical protein IJ688_14710 [Treponema sp.]|nr:hypothetical protein [Treponema sp.]
MKKSNKAVLNQVIRTRVTDEMFNMIQSIALRKNMDTASVVREIIAQYFEDTLSDSKIMSQNMIQTKRKISMLENKVEVMSMLILELAKSYTATFPDRHLTDELSQKFYEELVTRLAENMKNHKGRLESIVLDIYEKSGEVLS